MAWVTTMAGMLLLTATAQADKPGRKRRGEASTPSAPVVMLGDGLVAGPPASEAPPVAGGWVPSLADCLEERAPSRFAVIDRSTSGETAVSARERVAEVAELSPRIVVVSLGAQELADPEAEHGALTRELAQLARDLAGPHVLLVGLVSPTLAQTDYADSARQARADARTSEWNAALATLARSAPSMRHVDLWGDWPRGADRSELTQKGWSLSEPGHARVAAAVCDAVLDLPASPPSPAAAAPSPESAEPAAEEPTE